MQSKPKRAVKGTIAAAILVRMDDKLREAVRLAAGRDGLSDAEWLRRAAREFLRRRG